MAFADGIVKPGGTECSKLPCNLNISTTQNSKAICLADGTNCPASTPSQWIGTSPIYFNGNVGIGSTIPGQALDINGTIRTLSYIQSGASFNSFTGNVGIGSTIPSQKLDVNGTVRVTNFINTGLTASKVVFTNSNKQETSTGIGTSSQFIKGDSSLDSNTYLTTSAAASTYVPFVGFSDIEVNRIFDTTHQNYIQLSSSSNILIDASPTSGEVDINPNGGIVRTQNVIVDDSFGNSNATGQVGSGSGFKGDQTTGYSDNATYISYDNAGDVTLADINGAYRGVYTSYEQSFPQNIITDPNDELMGYGLNGNDSLWMFYRYGSADNDRFCIGENSISEAFCLSHGANSGITVGASYEAITAPANGMLIAGNSGIGTYLPSAQLEVGARKFDVLASGNVGIGSISPGQKLDVQGTVRALSSGACTYLYKCVGGVDAGVIQSSSCVLCPGGSCTQMNGCF